MILPVVAEMMWRVTGAAKRARSDRLVYDFLALGVGWAVSGRAQSTRSRSRRAIGNWIDDAWGAQGCQSGLN
jgi:hypothetical protein